MLPLMVGRGCPGVGPAGCLGEGGVLRVPSLHPPDSSGASGKLPGRAYPGALHPPSAVPQPHPHAAAGGGRGIPADVDAGQVLGDHPHTGAGPRRAEGGGDGDPRPPGGGVQHPLWRRHTGGHPPPPTIYETVQALGYHHLGDLYIAHHRVAGERALKERVPTCKGIPGLKAWLACHNAVLVPLLRAPTPRWQAAPKDWIPGAMPAYSAEAVIGGRVAKTTKEETVYHRGYAMKVSAAMKDAMEAEHGRRSSGCAASPPDALPSDTRLHRLLVALLGVQVQVNAPLHARMWDDHQHVPLDHLQGIGVLTPTIVWLSGQPTTAYWQWAPTSPTPLITVTNAVPPWPWIAIAPAAVAKFKYPAVCVAHKCPRHPYKGPLYYSLHTVGKLPAELHPALTTHLREHHRDLACRAPHGLATDPPPHSPAPEIEPGIWFHDLLALAKLRGAIVTVDAGTTPAGMAMAGVAQCGHGAYQAHVASGVGTSQEGEAMILLSYIRRLAVQPGVYWLVPNSEAVVGALRTYQEGGHCGDGIHHLYAMVLGGHRLAPTSAINVVTTPSHWITDLNVQVDAATHHKK